MEEKNISIVLDYGLVKVVLWVVGVVIVNCLVYILDVIFIFEWFDD